MISSLRPTPPLATWACWVLVGVALSLTACGKPKATSTSEAATATTAAATATTAKAAAAAPTAGAEAAAAAPEPPPAPPTPAIAPPQVEAPLPPDSLAAALRARLKAFRAKAPAAKQELMDQAIEDLAASGALQRALNNDAVAPDFTLPDATGKAVSLSALLKKGPVVLTWYRGGWCPYCNITLRRYAKLAPQLQAAGATLVAVSPDTPDNSLSTKEKLALPFVVLSDKNSDVARKYGLLFKLPPALHAMYDKAFDLKRWNGTDKGELPLAAAYVIGTDGKVRYSFVDADYRRRAEPAELLAAVKTRAAQPVK